MKLRFFSRFFTLIGMLVFAHNLFSQNIVGDKSVSGLAQNIAVETLKGQVVNGDTTLYYEFAPITFVPQKVFANNRQKKKYTHLVLNVKKVYPYSLIINETFREIDHALDSIKDKREQKRFLDMKEKELTDKFEKDIRSMTFAQGRILIKLVDRQTGYTSYEIIKKFKGNLTAVFWQSIARIFSTNLKYEYNADGEDKWIEDIVLQIEAGLI